MHEDSDYQDQDLKIDVINFNLQADRMEPYFKIVIDNECVHIYEGEVGNDKFNYITIVKGSELGQNLIKFYASHSLSTPIKIFMDEINAEKKLNAFFEDGIYVEEEMPNPTMTGVEVFRSYWKSLSEKEKIEYDCFKIPDVESLKDWYNLALHHHLGNIQHPIEYKQLVKDEKTRFRIKLIDQINWVLTDTSYPYMTEYSRYISGFHARELLEFKDWLSTLKEPRGVCSNAAALFCSLLVDGKLMQRGYEEDKKKFCNRVAQTYKLEFPVRTYKVFAEGMSIKKSDPYLLEIIEVIFPKIETNIRSRLQDLINSK